MRLKTGAFLLVLVFLAFAVSLSADETGNEPCAADPDGLPECVFDPYLDPPLLPDLMTVVPKHLSIQNAHQLELLRFSNGLANLGDGPWWLEPEFPEPGEGENCQAAFQLFASESQFTGLQIQAAPGEIPAPEDTIVARCEKGNFDFHETHNHWHIDNVGEFKVCTEYSFQEQGPGCAAAGNSIGIKFTFCLIDWYKLGDKTANSDPSRNFWDCATGFQGVTPGWVDQYHHTTPGQSIDITGLAAGRYVLVSTVNVGSQTGQPVFEELDTTNNSAWVTFDLLRRKTGNAKLDVIDNACTDGSDFRDDAVAAAERFVALYHSSDPDLAEAIVDGICGGQRLNR